MKLTTQFHLMPRSKNALPPICFHGVVLKLSTVLSLLIYMIINALFISCRLVILSVVVIPVIHQKLTVCHPAGRVMKLLPLSLPPVAAMDRLPLSLPFSPTDLLWRYPLGFPAAPSQPPPMSPLLDFKTHLPTSLGGWVISL
jgi:hypothetical protein